MSNRVVRLCAKALCLLTLAGFLAACSGRIPSATAVPDSDPAGTQEAARTSPDPATFVQVTFGEPETLDPALGYDTASNEMILNIYEPLIFYDGIHTDRFVPLLAESWRVSDDGRVYTFKIRSGVTFHEGQTLTAEDVAYSFQRGLLLGGRNSPQWLLAELFFGVGVEDITCLVDGCASMDDRDALAAQDSAALLAACQQVKAAITANESNGTVTMTLAQPWGPFLPTIAQTWGGILDKDWAIANGAWDGSCETWQNYYAEPAESNPLSRIANGTGPFKLGEWKVGEELILFRNENYWREPARLARVVTKYVSEWGTRFAMMQAGDADIVAVPAENRSQMDALVGEVCEFDADTARYKPCQVVNDSLPYRLYRGSPTLSRTDMFFNFQVAEGSNYIGSGKLDGNGIPPDFFSDVHIRRAFAYCFDWDVYISDVFNGEAVQSPVIPLAGMPGYQADAPVYSYDPAKCEEEFKLADLDNDGIPAGSDPEGDVWTTGFRLQALYNQGNTSRQTIADILAINVASINNLFVIETVGLPWPTFLRTTRNRQAPYFVSGWAEDIHDPHNWYVPYTIGSFALRQSLPKDLQTQFRNLVNRGAAETDPAARQRIYEQLNRLFYDQTPTILLAVATGHTFEQRWVHGTLLNPIFPGEYFYPMYKD
ncbi:MAG: ABC transporter substrate-binding protein [Chloroflexota bacterium]|nr:ABC transporter substrate-binding protein [Chloroflexota bacterium]MBI5702226.1 ABC transporter substrate-binding protein [Chloroflexota bacterium]